MSSLHHHRGKNSQSFKKKPKPPPNVTVHELEEKQYILTARPPVKLNTQEVVLPPQNPPQGEYLADEYVRNLQQQLYFLNAELRFLQDRSGTTNADGPGIDASIRRLRKAMAQYEEETNKKIAKITDDISERRVDISNVNETAALDVLADANVRERDELQTNEIAFVESAALNMLNQVKLKHSDANKDFLAAQRQALEDIVETQKSEREQFESDLSKAVESIVNLKDQRKAYYNDIENLIRNKFKSAESKDILIIVSSEPEIPQPNVSISTLKSKNAKIEVELRSVKESRKEAKKQLKDLLEKNAKLYSEFNILEAKAKRGRSIKDTMINKFTQPLQKQTDESNAVLEELESLRNQKRDLINKIKDSTEECTNLFNKYNELLSESEQIKSVIAFKQSEVDLTNSENEGTMNEINGISSNIVDVRKDLDDLTNKIAEADEKLKKLQTLVARNAEDPRSQMLNLPKELQALLDNLTSVKKQIIVE